MEIIFTSLVMGNIDGNDGNDKHQWSVVVDQVGAFDDAGIENVENIQDAPKRCHQPRWKSQSVHLVTFK